VHIVTRSLAQQIVLAACAVALLLAPVPSLLPADTVASRTPNHFHWARKQRQFTLQVGDNVDGGWNSLLNRVVSDWNRGDTVTFRIVNGSTNPQECRERAGTVQVCNSRYGTQVGWLGLTRLYFNDRGEHIDAATVQMNDSFLDTNSQYSNEAARRHTLCHELGHTPGLDHVSTNSCMNDSQQAVFDNLVPINRDFRQLERIYKHKDSTTTVAGKQKKQKNKNKKKQDSKDKKNKNKKKDKDNDKKKESRKRARERMRERKRARNERAGSESFFDPTSLPSVPSGLDADETVMVETLDDGRKVVSFITWADEPVAEDAVADE
jgi:hypothetical protein